MPHWHCSKQARKLQNMFKETHNTVLKPGLPNPLHPASYTRRVLLAVCGLSPQVVTETLYALAVPVPGVFVPTEVHLITTTEGARRAELSLLSNDLGWFHKICADYHLIGITFDASHIHVIQSASGQPMDDIRTDQDNRDAANFMTAKVRQITADPACALHVSIAGGRKTMGFYLGYALSLYGRAQDRLSHVLVSEPFESSWDFFYPTPASHTLKTKDGTLADTATAKVSLADIPFVSLRHGLPTDLLTGKAGFNDTVAAARACLAPPELVLDIPQQRIHAGGKVIALPPAELALLAVFARRIKQGLPPLEAPAKDAGDLVWAASYLREYRAITGKLADIENTERALRNGMDGGYFSPRKTKLEQRIKAALGSSVHAYRISDGGKRPRKYQLELLPDAIRFISDSEPRESI